MHLFRLFAIILSSLLALQSFIGVSAKGPNLSKTKISALKKTIAQKKSAVKERTQLAAHFNAQGDADSVIAYLRPEAESLDITGMRLLAKAYEKKKDYLQVVRVLQFLVTQNKNDYVSYARLGQAYLNINKVDDSIKSYQTSVSINKRFRKAYDGLLLALAKANRKYDRRETLIDMIDQFGTQPELLDEMCRTYYEDGFLEEAKVSCQEAISKSPNVAENHIFLGLTFKAANNLPRSIAIIQRTAKQFTNSELAQYTAAQLNESKKNTLAAYKFYKRGAKSDDTSSRSWLGFANMAFELKNYEEALKAYKHSCKLDRQNSVQDFRSAASKLKKQNNFKWKNKFSSAALKCRYQAG